MWQEVHNNRSLLAASVDVINSYRYWAVGIDLFTGEIIIAESFGIQRILKKKCLYTL